MTLQTKEKHRRRKARPSASDLDPASEAERFLTELTEDGRPRLIAWRGEFFQYARGRYQELPKREVRNQVISHLNKAFIGVTTSVTNNVLDQLQALAAVSADTQPPSWLNPRRDDWSATEVISARNGLVNVKLLLNGADCMVPHTPRFFTQTALSYDVDRAAPEPCRWLKFLDQLWHDEQDSVEALQELFGYLVVGGTWLQKIFLFVGPPRSGKSTIARVMRELIGLDNCCAPALAGLASNFGLWPLLGKSLATINDARISSRTDQAVVVERLLSTSGEDAQTIDRKHLEPLTTTLPTRIVMLTNELPRLGDDSGALARRMILWRFNKSFLGRENPSLSSELMAELPSIFHWSMQGWKRLIDRGRLVQPVSGSQLVAEIEDLGSPVSAFMRDTCIVSRRQEVPVADLFRAWKGWCDEKGHEPGNQHGLGRNLHAAVPGLRVAQKCDGKGGKFRMYAGVGLRALATSGH